MHSNFMIIPEVFLCQHVGSAHVHCGVLEQLNWEKKNQRLIMGRNWGGKSEEGGSHSAVTCEPLYPQATKDSKSLPVPHSEAEVRRRLFCLCAI